MLFVLAGRKKRERMDSPETASCEEPTSWDERAFAPVEAYRKVLETKNHLIRPNELLSLEGHLRGLVINVLRREEEEEGSEGKSEWRPEGGENPRREGGEKKKGEEDRRRDWRNRWVQPKFNGYKTKAFVGWGYTERGKDAVLDRFATREYACPGTCIAGTKSGLSVSGCESALSLEVGTRTYDEVKGELGSWEFDHVYRRKDVESSMRSALRQTVGRKDVGGWFDTHDPNVIGDDMRTLFVKEHGFVGTPERKPFKKNYSAGSEFESLQKLILQYLDVDRYADDLYGSNLVMRCVVCHSAGRSADRHPPFDSQRYVRTPETNGTK